MDSLLLTPRHVAKILNVSYFTVLRLAHSGHIPHVVVGKKAIRFDRLSIEQRLGRELTPSELVEPTK